MQLDLDGLLRRMLNGPMLPTQERFIKSRAPAKAYMGPAGCAKTSTGCAAILTRALLNPGYRAAICRYDYNDLMSTTKRRMEEMLERLPPGLLIDRDKSPPERWWIRSAIPGATEPSEIMFMGLKEYPGGLEVHDIFVDEADECELSIVAGLQTRLRAPAPAGVSEASITRELSIAFNPPDKHHWIYTACTGLDFKDKKVPDSPAWLDLYKPQPNENVINLPHMYYERMAANLPEDMRQRLIEGNWGSAFAGQPVYREFAHKMHVRDIKHDPDLVTFRFWDFGYRHPVCIWAQIDEDGRLKRLYEMNGQDEEVVPFARRVKAETVRKFRVTHPDGVMDFGDPAVIQKKDTGQALAMLANEGITMLFKTSTIEEGVRRIRLGLEQLIRGEPAFQYDRRGVPVLIAAMKGGYHLDPSGQKPVKDGHYDHSADADRYGVVNLYAPDGTVLNDGAARFGGGHGSQIPDSLEYSDVESTVIL